MPVHVGPIDPSQPVTVQIAGRSSHAIAFALWWRPPDREAWTALGTGRTGDGAAEPRIFSLDATPRTQLYYWIAVSSPERPHAAYHAAITVAQRGVTLPHGAIDCRGTTDAAGNEAVESWIDLL